MKNTKNLCIAMLGLALGAVALCAPTTAYAQEKQLNSVTLDLKDAPIRATLEMAFKQAGINNYLIDNNVVGFVTMTITEQPFENALKLIMRAASVPLTYTKENNVWIVKPRTVTQTTTTVDTAPDPSVEAPRTNSYERVNLSYLDAMDLDQIVGGIIYVRSFTRQQQGGGMMGGGMMGRGMMGGGMGGGMMGGMGGGMMGGGMMGGMGGGMMGGGMGGGMMGGGMGGGMMGGGMGGGMMGGGGFGGMLGGGRGF